MHTRSMLLWPPALSLRGCAMTDMALQWPWMQRQMSTIGAEPPTYICIRPLQAALLLHTGLGSLPASKAWVRACLSFCTSTPMGS